MLEFLKIDLSNNIAIFIIIVMFFFSLFLVMKIKRLKEEIESLKFEDKTIFQKKVSNLEEDVVSIGKISKYENKDEGNELEEDIVMKDEVVKKENINIGEKVELKKDSVLSEKNDVFGKENNNEELLESNTVENILDDASLGVLPVSTEFDNIDIERASFNLDEFVKDNGKVNNKNNNSHLGKDDYLNEISRRMAEELAPQTIELTDYEKDQEENAIISYQELLSVKDNVSILENDDVDFIEELKKLRNSLD